MTPPPPLQAETEQLKRQIEELSGRIGELMAEKDTLQNRNSLLEKVVQVRSASDKSAQPQVCRSASSLDECPAHGCLHHVPASTCHVCWLELLPSLMHPV